MAFALHDREGNVYRSRITRIGDTAAEKMSVKGEARPYPIAGGQATVMVYEGAVPGVDVFASVTDLGVEWNVRLLNADAPRTVEFDAELPFDTPNAQGRIQSTDAEGNWADVRIDSRTEANGEKVRMITTKEFLGRVSVRDPKTRIRTWSEEVKWPVRVR